MIALIVGEAQARRGPLGLAFAHAGFEPRGISTPDDAAREVAAHGAEACLLVVDAHALERGAGGASWTGLLTRHADLAAVLVARGPARSEAPALVREPHRVLLEDPFDAAAVVAAARRASSPGRPRPTRVASRLREAG